LHHYFKVEEQKTVEGFAVIRGKKTVAFTNVEEFGRILTEDIAIYISTQIK